MRFLDENRYTLGLYWGLRALMVLAVIIFILRGQPDAAAATLIILALMLAPSLVKRRWHIYLPFEIDLSTTLFVFLTLFVGEVARVYYSLLWWDKFIHFQSGLLLGATGYVLIYALNEHSTKLRLSPGFISLFAVAFSVFIGAVWEMLEFLGDVLFNATWQGGNTDTMLDLLADFAGALILSVVGYFWMYRYKRLPLTPWPLRLWERIKRPPER